MNNEKMFEILQDTIEYVCSHGVTDSSEFMQLSVSMVMSGLSAWEGEDRLKMIEWVREQCLRFDATKKAPEGMKN